MSEITTAKRAHVRRLDQMKREYQAVIRDLPLGVVGLDYEGKCVLVNQSVRRFLGIDDSRALGRRLCDLVIARELRAILGEQIEMGRDGFATVRAAQFGGRALEIRSTIPAEIDRVCSLVFTVEDVTWRRRAEDQKEEFLALVSHELRTPLTVIKGYLDIFERGLMGGLSAQQVDTTRIMLEQCQRLERLIRDLIRFRSLTRGPGGIRPQPVALMPFLSQLSADVHRAVEDAGMAMTLSVHSSDLVCWCDACQLRDVLQQLVDNAVKFASGGKYLELSARQCAVSDLPPSSRRLVLHEPTPESRWVMIEVADHGPGIPAEAIDRLFGAFEQGEEHLSRKVRGLGIGLAVVRRVIELNGGTLWVDSVPGGGTKVSLTLPQFDPSQQL